MGLERCTQAFSLLDIDFSQQLVITVAGTNGKGTTCAFIEQYCLQNGLSVGVFSSPHITSFCERIRLNGVDIDSQELCEIFAHIKHKKQQLTLTYFEFATLAAFEAFDRKKPDVVILEVGLGGRLDAVNVVDPDIAVITSIGLDHQDWLGSTREEIGFEKAGIFRASCPTVIGEPDCPKSIKIHANELGIKALFRGKDFDFDENESVTRIDQYRFNVSQAFIPKQNVATGLAVIKLMNNHSKFQLACNKVDVKPTTLDDFAVNTSLFEKLLKNTKLAGRHQILQHRIDGKQALIVADVAHNEDSARQLRTMIADKFEDRLAGKCHIVIGMLKDKNIEVSIQAFDGLNIVWYCASLPSVRGETAKRLINAVTSLSSSSNALASPEGFDTVEEAFLKAKTEAYPQDTILVMGSFLTVSAVMSLSSRA